MLPKRCRLTTSEFEEVIKAGRTTDGVNLSLKFFVATTNQNKSLKLAAVAPSRVAKTSVAKHKVKRRLYNLIREVAIEPQRAARVALFAKNDLTKVTNEVLKEEISQLFKRAKLS